jgi:hypothetical protein
MSQHCELHVWIQGSSNDIDPECFAHPAPLAGLFQISWNTEIALKNVMLPVMIKPSDLLGQLLIATFHEAA